MKKEALIIFIKNPELGKAKTRLAATLGKPKALEIYHQLLRHTNKISKQLPIQKYLYYSSFINETDHWDNSLYHKKLQVQGNLGDKMISSFREVLTKADKCVIIGSDCAELTSEIIMLAFQALEKTDFVIGPSRDGGYYLLGMKAFTPSIFQEIPWSTAEVSRLTQEKIEQESKTCTLLPLLSDIDTEEDWLKFGKDNLK